MRQALHRYCVLRFQHLREEGPTHTLREGHVPQQVSQVTPRTVLHHEVPDLFRAAVRSLLCAFHIKIDQIHDVWVSDTLVQLDFIAQRALQLSFTKLGFRRIEDFDCVLGVIWYLPSKVNPGEGSFAQRLDQCVLTDRFLVFHYYNAV